MATQQTPPNQVLIGLALFLTAAIMAPTYQKVYDDAMRPYMDSEIGAQDALDLGMKPVREFMLRQVAKHPKDLALFITINKLPRPQTPDNVPTHVLICAYTLNELRVAFMIGFIIYIPFLIIDMVVASTLMAMGMMMLPPVFISLPFLRSSCSCLPTAGTSSSANWSEVSGNAHQLADFPTRLLHRLRNRSPNNGGFETRPPDRV